MSYSIKEILEYPISDFYHKYGKDKFIMYVDFVTSVFQSYTKPFTIHLV